MILLSGFNLTNFNSFCRFQLSSDIRLSYPAFTSLFLVHGGSSSWSIGKGVGDRMLLVV